jgi:hypothetical protein
MPSERIKAYLAGFLDADGCINSFRPNGQTPRLRVSIANQDPRPLNLLKELYGGYISISGQTCTAWMTNNKDEILNFLTDVEPDLLVKRDRAILALEFVSLNVGNGGPTNDRNRTARQRREEISDEITRLNHTKTPFIQERKEAFQLAGVVDPTEYE